MKKIEAEYIRDGKTLRINALPGDVDTIALVKDDKITRFVRMDQLGYPVMHQVIAPAPDELFVMEFKMSEPHDEPKFTEEPGEECPINEVDAHMIKYVRVRGGTTVL